MSAVTEVTILYRHPDANVRRLPAKPLEYKDPAGKTQFFLAEEVNSQRGPQVIYKVPVDFARRMLANQPERYFLMEPNVLVIKRKLPGGFSSETLQVTNKVAAKFLASENPDDVAAKAKADEDDRRKTEAERKAKADAKAKAEDEEKAKADEAAKHKAAQDAKDRDAQAAREKADQDAMRALETAPLETAELPDGTPPQVF